MKRIFTPYARGVGNLAGRLPYVGTKPDVLGKPKGRTKGFKPEEYLYAPDKDAKGYVKTKELEGLLTSDDELYINAHCSKGLDYLACQESCPEDKKVTIPDLIAQLEAIGLSKETQAKIKFWICEGALDSGMNQSFCQRFSAEFDLAGYKTCRVFGYSLSVFSEYKDGPDGLRKRTVSVLRGRLEKFTAQLDEELTKLKGGQKPETMSAKELSALFMEVNKSEVLAIKKFRPQFTTWVAALMLARGDRNEALTALENNPFNLGKLGIGAGGVADRASKSRVEFKAGRIVPG